ncbi:MAG TPA: hypothetical protein VGG48_04505 [Rhizomicrobium sp.]
MKTAFLALTALLAATPAAQAQTSGEPTMATQTDHAHDFDFLVGKWRVHHHRLKARLAGSTEWQDFEGTSEMQMTMGGQGTFDENYLDIPSGAYRAVGIRGYDPKTQTWAIWWLDARQPHSIEPPVLGNFQNGVGTFTGDDTFNGKPIVVRFTWSRITATSAHWEQAFSPDGGKSWETNWVMDLTRVR